MKEKIDFVVLWVDGSDEEWSNNKKYWQKKCGIEKNSESRYREINDFKYWFRSIEKYASWVNHVFLVTDKQVPKWLDKNYKKLTVIDHNDIIEEGFLPVFNSNSIEINIHKIPNLSEKFVYFNDDTFIVNYTEEKDFFQGGKPVDIGTMDLIYPKKDNNIQKVILNNVGIINENFKKYTTIKEKMLNWFNYKYGIQNINNILLLKWKIFTNFSNHHLPIPFLKSTFETVWELYFDELNRTVSNKFRTDSDYNVWLMRYWQLASNNFKPRSKSIGKAIQLKDFSSAKECSEIIIGRKYKLLCINDNEQASDLDLISEMLNEAFGKKLSIKSRFEI